MKTYPSSTQIILLLFCVFFCLSVGGFSGYLSSNEVYGWYLTVQKPSWNPPNWLFGPVWICLYICMGISLFLNWTNKNPETPKKLLLSLFFIQLFLNGLWSIVFFRWHATGWALVEIIALLATMIAYTFLSYKTQKWASLLFIPYILWVSFASCLTYAIWQLNKGL
jgi:tryptophan-rich sensory protein